PGSRPTDAGRRTNSSPDGRSMMRPTRRRTWFLTLTAATVALTAAAGPAFACGGVFSQNGEVNLTRTTTLAGYADGVEHYVTAFEFAGAGGRSEERRVGKECRSRWAAER